MITRGTGFTQDTVTSFEWNIFIYDYRMTIHEDYARKTNAWTANSLSDNTRLSVSCIVPILVSCDCTVLTLSRASGICSLPGWPGNLRHQLPWIQIHDDTAVSRKKLASNQQCLASRNTFRSYGPQLRCSNGETVPCVLPTFPPG
jgi:hypothetical protein